MDLRVKPEGREVGCTLTNAPPVIPALSGIYSKFLC